MNEIKTTESEIESSSINAYFIVNPADFLSTEFDLEAWLNKTLLKTYSDDTKRKSIEVVDDTIVDYVQVSSINSVKTALNLPTLNLTQPPSINEDLPDNKHNLDKLASKLLSQLESLSYELSSQLDVISTSTLQSLSQVFHDLEQTKRQMNTISSQIKINKDNIINARVPAISNGLMNDNPPMTFNQQHTLEYLIKVDAVKSRMEASKKMLKEAENWNTLPVEMEGIFASKDYSVAASRLQEAQRSLVLLSGSSDYEDKKNMLGGLQNKLEAFLSPQVITALNDRDVEGCKTLYKIFNQIQRSSEFATYYFRLRKSTLTKSWDHVKINVNNLSNGPSIATILDKFYDEMNKLVSKEAEWLPYIFPHPLDVLLELAKDIFTTISNEVKSKLIDLKDNIVVIVEAYNITCSYGVKLERTLSSIRDVNGLIVKSSKMDMTESLSSMLEPFIDIQQDYSSYESSYLTAQLNTTLSSITKNNRGIEVIQTALDCIRVLSSHAETAITRCRVFTSGFGSVGLKKALDLYIQQLADIFTVTILKKLDINNSEGGSEWNEFHVGLRVLGISCSLIQRFLEIDDNVKTLIIYVDGKLQSGITTNEFTSALHILRLSTLNSHVLQSLISSISPSSVSPNTSKSNSGKIILNLEPIERLAINTQQSTFNILMNPIQKQLDFIPTLSIWANARPNSSSPFGISVPQFSLSPSPYATRVGEHLLALPQQMELYQDDESLKYNTHSLPFYDESLDKDLDAALVWMSCVVRATANSLSSNFLKIGSLSIYGKEQLKEDIGYMINVFAAMEVEPDSRLKNIQKGIDGIQEVVGSSDGDVTNEGYKERVLQLVNGDEIVANWFVETVLIKLHGIY